MLQTQFELLEEVVRAISRGRAIFRSSSWELKRFRRRLVRAQMLHFDSFEDCCATGHDAPVDTSIKSLLPPEKDVRKAISGLVLAREQQSRRLEAPFARHLRRLNNKHRTVGRERELQL
jgi:hypothetical protein